MKQTIKITYNGKLDNAIDTKIRTALETQGLNFQWVGQGYNMQTAIRDISFEREAS